MTNLYLLLSTSFMMGLIAINHQLIGQNSPGNTDVNNGKYPTDTEISGFGIPNQPITFTDTIWPQQLPYWTGSTDGNSFTQNSLIRISSGGVEAGWAKFDISSVPDNTPINSLKLGYYINNETGSPAYYINKVNSDPITGTPLSVFNDIQNGSNYLSTNNNFTVGWHLLDLPTDAEADFSAATVQDWFALGFFEYNIYPSCFSGTMDGWNQVHQPYLLINYSYIQAPNDVGVTEIVHPVSGAGLSSNETITIKIHNYGLADQTAIPIKVNINRPSGLETITDTWTGNLAAGDSVLYTLSTTADLSLFWNYTIHACTELVGDAFTNNDCNHKIINNNCPLVVQSIDHPTSGTGLTSAESLEVTLKNIGAVVLSNVEIRYTLNGGAPIVCMYPGPLAPNASTTFNPGTLDLHFFTTYTIQVCPFFQGNTAPNDGCNVVSIENSLPTVTDTFWPQSAPFWTGSLSGTLTQNSIIEIYSDSLIAGWAKFDITDMPSVAEVNSVDLHFYVSTQSGGPQFRIIPMSKDPMATPPPTLLLSMLLASPYLDSLDGSGLGWQVYTLGQKANTHLLNQTASDWFSVGFLAMQNCAGCYLMCDGWAETNRPYIVVNYFPPLLHDIAVNSIVIDTLIASGWIIPRAKVTNRGVNNEILDVTMTATGGYSSTKTVGLPPGVSEYVIFDPWDVPLGPKCAEVTSLLAMDPNYNNNHLQLCWNNIIPSNVYGTVTYNNNYNTLMQDSTMVLLTRVNPPGYILVDTVDINGHFSFTNLPAGTFNLQVISEKSWGGGNASDALAVLKHFVGMTTLTGLNLTAADANADGLVNSLDALMILQRFIWALYTFPAGDWVSDQPFVTMPPAQNAPVNLKVLCTGDVNGSYVP